MSGVYTAPESDLIENTDDQEYGSVEKATSGNYQFQVFEVLEEAWSKTKGVKGSFWLAFIIYLVVAIGIVGAFLGLGAVLGEESALLVALLEQVTLTAIGTPMLVGIIMIGVKHSVNAPKSGTLVLNYFYKTLPLFIVILTMYLLIVLGLILLVIPGIYLTIAYYFGSLLVVEKNMSPWEALETSRKAITHRWFAVFGLALMTSLINIVGAIPAFLGLIWTIPMSVMAFAILYRNMFGIESINRQ